MLLSFRFYAACFNAGRKQSCGGRGSKRAVVQDYEIRDHGANSS